EDAQGRRRQLSRGGHCRYRMRRGRRGPRRPARGVLPSTAMEVHDPRAHPLQGKIIVLGVAGGIAAYKAAELTRLLVKAGASAHIIMTRAAGEFIRELTFQTLSGNKVATDLFDLTQESDIGHIKLADQAHLVLVAPATANLIARMAAGMG